MIIALVGTSHLPFDRFIKAVAKLAKDFDLEIIVQYGHTNIDSTNLNGFDFCSNDELLNLISHSNLVICQGGFGSMFDAIKSGDRVIVIPRKQEFGEADSDQMALTTHYAKLGLVELCEDPGKLNDVYKNYNKVSTNQESNIYPLVKNILSEYL